MALCTALEAANYLVYLTQGALDDLSNMKLNKLLYFAQGHCLKQTGHVLFDDTIEAWDHGTIIYDVYKKYQRFDNAPITAFDAEEAKKMPQEAITILIDTVREYGKYTAVALRNMTHAQKSPWDLSYKKGQMRVPIEVELIRDYFCKHEKPIDDLQIALDSSDFIGYRDSEGYLVLPKEWDE